VARLAAIVTSSQDAIISKDLAGVIKTWNRGAEHLFGYTAAEAIGRPVTMLIPEDRLDEEPQILARIRRGEPIEHYETVRQCKDGTLLDISLSVSPLCDGSGRVVGASKVARDVTYRKRAESTMRESQERFRMLADNMDQLAWTCDTLGNCTWYNQRWLDYTGMSFDETKGWDWSKVQHPDHLERVVERVRQSAEAGLPWEDTFPLRGKDGEYRWFLSRAVPIRDAAGNVACWFGTNTDVTALRELEDKNSKQAQALADLNRRKDEFLAMLSHELRNPLAPILNAVQLLRLQKDGSAIQREAHGMIERQVSQLARLVDDLLEVSRITTGRIHLQVDRLDLRLVVERAIEATRPLAGQKSQSIAKSLPEWPVCVLGDAVRLEQVVVNLLNNACKYTDHKGHIAIGLALQEDEAELRICDNGIGIAPDVLPRIFDLFAQADKSLDRSRGGLGIGLALVQSLVTMHRGRVEAHSTPGQGSEFIVRLPAIGGPDVSIAKPAETLHSSAYSLKVLVVDDNVDAAKGMAMLLRTYGHDARVAHDGAAAMQAALEYVPDVVLLDIGLPVINGFQVAQWIRKEPALNNAVVIALTGYGQESDRRRSQEAGFDHHLVKPVEFATVEAILSAAVARARGHT
jgi:PAS domain S-box-containing protein